MTAEEIRERLRSLSEEDYKEFNRKLIPGVEHVMGIRLPAMRSLPERRRKKIFAHT